MKILIAAIVAYILGLLVFYTAALYHIKLWWWLYYFWDKGAGAGVLSWASIYTLSPPAYKKIVKPVVIFSVIRFAWEICSYFTGVTASNEWRVAALFLALISVTSYYMFRGFKKLNNYL